MKKIILAGSLFCLALIPRTGLAACPAVDNFTGSGNLDPSNWLNFPALTGSSNVTSISLLQQVSNTVVPSVAGTQGMSTWNGSDCTPSANQSATVTLNTTPSGNTGPGVRGNVANGTGYVWAVRQASIFRINAPILNGINQVAEYCGSYVQGATYTLTVRGSTLYAYQNGVLVCHGGDNILPSGEPFVLVDQTINGGTGSVSNFTATDALPAPVLFNYPTQTFAFSPVLTMTSPDGAPVFYSTSGTATCSSTPYSTPLTITNTTTVSAIACPATEPPSTPSSVTLTIRSGGPQTWYVRPDGGTRYSSNVPHGQCNGTADASYVSVGGITNALWQPNTVYAPGATITDNQGFYETTSAGLTSGSAWAGPTWGGGTTPDGTGSWTQGAAYPTNQNCAFGNVWNFWNDGSYADGTSFPGWGWIGAGGDTYLIKGSIADGVSYRVGAGNPTTSCGANNCQGLVGRPRDSGSPAILSGSPSNHTVVEGENHGACASQSARTQLHGGWGVGSVLGVEGSCRRFAL